MPMLKRMRRRLGSKAGESFTEVLAALMISAIALMLLAGMITSASNMVTRSTDKIQSYVAAEAAMIEKSGTGISCNVTFKKDSGIEGGTATPLKLKNASSWNNDGSHPVTVYKNTESIGNTTVVLY